MPSLADVLRRHAPVYLQRHGDAVLPSHARAVQAITQCRTAALGGHLAECTRCASTHVLFHSCRHRACPRCGHDAAARWLAHQETLLLPVPYFHVVFTLPAELRRAVRSNQRALLRVLFVAAFESLAALCADPRWLGGRIGALAVLHTWTRTLEWHPHFHLLVPAGALAPDGRTWLAPKHRRKPFLVPVRALSEHFRGRFMTRARAALPHLRLHVPWSKRWVVFAKPAVQGPQRVLAVPRPLRASHRAQRQGDRRLRRAHRERCVPRQSRPPAQVHELAGAGVSAALSAACAGEGTSSRARLRTLAPGASRDLASTSADACAASARAARRRRSRG